MIPGAWNDQSRRPTFPPAPAIPTYVHLQSSNERGSVLEPQPFQQPRNLDEQSAGSIHPGESSSSPERDLYLNEVSREVQYSPSVFQEPTPSNRADANFLQ